MEYSEEQLEQVEKLASIYMKISDIALIIEVNEDDLRSDIAAQITDVSLRYRRGKALSKVQIRSQEMALAKVRQGFWKDRYVDDTFFRRIYKRIRIRQYCIRKTVYNVRHFAKNYGRRKVF